MMSSSSSLPMSRETIQLDDVSLEGTSTMMQQDNHICLECLKPVTLAKDAKICGGPPAIRRTEPTNTGCGAAYHPECVSSYRSWVVWKCKNPACLIGVARDIDATDEIMAHAIDQCVEHHGNWWNIKAIAQLRRTFSRESGRCSAIAAAANEDVRASCWWSSWAHDKHFRQYVITDICKMMRNAVLRMRGIVENEPSSPLHGGDMFGASQLEAIKTGIATLAADPSDPTALRTVMAWNNLLAKANPTAAAELPAAVDAAVTELAANFTGISFGGGEFARTILAQALGAVGGIHQQPAGRMTATPNNVAKWSRALRVGFPIALLGGIIAILLCVPGGSQLGATAAPGSTPAPGPFPPGPTPASAGPSRTSMNAFQGMSNAIGLLGTVFILIFVGILWLTLFLKLNWPEALTTITSPSKWCGKKKEGGPDERTPLINPT